MSSSVVVVLNTLVIIAILISAILTVYSKRLLSSIICMGVTGAFVSLEFIILHAPDVAIAEAAVGAVLSTVLLVTVLRKVKTKEEEEQ